MILLSDNVSRRFGQHWAVSGVNIRLAQGESLLIAGRNGAGKTTLLRLLAGMLRPTQGTVTVNGHSTTDDAFGVRQSVAMLAQRNGLYLELTARENLAVIEKILVLPTDKQRVPELLRRVGLDDYQDVPVRTFSSGMRKRLALAKVLIQDAPLVFFDEPYGQLDTAGFDFIDGLFASLLSAGKTLVVVTHWVERAAPLIGQAMILERGAMTWVGPTRDLGQHFGKSSA